MKRLLKTLTLSLLLIANQDLSAQSWTWINGTSNLNDYGTYGTQGVEAPTNKPGGRRDFVTWKDSGGTMWLFGGYGRASSTTVGYLCDLWKYNPANSQWTWMGGATSQNQLGIYGTQLVSAPTNRPGGRRFATAWADASGNLWLFGGFGLASSGGVNRLNDLWKYNTTTNQWTWMSGANTTNQLADYTTIGALRPGARYSSMSWFDGTYAWIYGGDGNNNASNGPLADLWKYDAGGNTWTYVSGDNTLSAPAVYGTLGVSALTNKPGARSNGAAWFNANTLYMFGGSVSNQLYSDLWTYDIATNMWTWIKGPNSNNVPGTYGTMWVTDANSNPGGRYFTTAMKDNIGRFWLIGGTGYGSTATSGLLNDVWGYRPSDNTWTWVKGTGVVDDLSSYGTQNLTSGTNQIGARTGTGGWMNSSNNIILVMGYGNTTTTTPGYLNDVWTFGSAATLPVVFTNWNAIKEDENIRLGWSTSSEKNSDHFEVWHSTDGKEFIELGREKSAGNSDAIKNYSMIHHSPDFSKTNSYKLKQVDVDGKSNESGIVTVLPDVDGPVSISLFQQANSELNFSASRNAQFFHIYNTQGQMIWQESNHQDHATISTNGWLPGIYFFEVELKGGLRKTIKFIVR